MPPTVIELDQLTPDLVVEYQGKRYAISGDPPIEMYLEMHDLKAELDQGKPSEERAIEIMRRFVEMVGDMFRDRDPSLERLPFGVVHCQKIVEALVANAVPEGNRTTRRDAARAKTPPRKPPARRR